MEATFFSKILFKSAKKQGSKTKINNLAKGKINVPYIIKNINTNDQEIENFLFTLGCYEGEDITVISKLADNFVISVRDARYSIDTDLAKAIII